jgi:hypothetical protein
MIAAQVRVGTAAAAPAVNPQREGTLTTNKDAALAKFLLRKRNAATQQQPAEREKPPAAAETLSAAAPPPVQRAVDANSAPPEQPTSQSAQSVRDPARRGAAVGSAAVESRSNGRQPL